MKAANTSQDESKKLPRFALPERDVLAARSSTEYCSREISSPIA